jgi:predicted CXXCH cytochrome family protein
MPDRDCLTCHTPHFGAGKRPLPEPQKNLCLNCHDQIEEAMTAAYPHAILEDEDCTLCHDPHFQRLNDAQVDLCGLCHEPDPESHAGRQPSQCSECHDPHGSDSPHLLRPTQHSPFEERECNACHDSDEGSDAIVPDDICMDCHEMPERTGAHADLERSDGKCAHCHSPHAASNAGLIKSTK